MVRFSKYSIKAWTLSPCRLCSLSVEAYHAVLEGFPELQDKCLVRPSLTASQREYTCIHIIKSSDMPFALECTVVINHPNRKTKHIYTLFIFFIVSKGCLGNLIDPYALSQYAVEGLLHFIYFIYLLMFVYCHLLICFYFF